MDSLCVCPWPKMVVVFLFSNCVYEYLCGKGTNNIKTDMDSVHDPEARQLFKKVNFKPVMLNYIFTGSKCMKQIMISHCKRSCQMLVT